MNTLPPSTQLHKSIGPPVDKQSPRHRKGPPAYHLYCARCGQWTTIEGSLHDLLQLTGMPILCVTCAIDETTDFPTSINDTF